MALLPAHKLQALLVLVITYGRLTTEVERSGQPCAVHAIQNLPGKCKNSTHITHSAN